MKIKNKPAPYSVPTIGKRAWAVSSNQTGNMLVRTPRRRSRYRPFPSFPWFPPPWQHPLDSNRAFARWARSAWKNILSAGNRAAWAAVAATHTIQNFKLIEKFGPGFQLFQYYHHAWRWWWYQPCRPFDSNLAPPDLEPYLPWEPPPKPDNFVILESYPEGIKIQFTCVFPDNNPCLVTQVATKRGPKNPEFTHAFMNLAVPLAHTRIPPNTYQTTLNWQGILPVPPEPGPRIFRFRGLARADHYTPGFRRRVSLTLS